MCQNNCNTKVRGREEFRHLTYEEQNCKFNCTFFWSNLIADLLFIKTLCKTILFSSRQVEIKHTS